MVTVLLGDALWLPFVSIQSRRGCWSLFPDGRLASRREALDPSCSRLAGAVIGSLGLAISPEVYAIKLPNPLALGPEVVERHPRRDRLPDDPRRGHRGRRVAARDASAVPEATNDSR